ncbi:hypothetical protein B0H11DRAFT_2289447 [Mycena galericulata]|nr:hypothetical protein B0H11DRAFT_2289447 [Mycena galericulata]
MRAPIPPRKENQKSRAKEEDKMGGNRTSCSAARPSLPTPPDDSSTLCAHTRLVDAQRVSTFESMCAPGSATTAPGTSPASRLASASSEDGKTQAWGADTGVGGDATSSDAYRDPARAASFTGSSRSARPPYDAASWRRERGRGASSSPPSTRIPCATAPIDPFPVLRRSHTSRQFGGRRGSRISCANLLPSSLLVPRYSPRSALGRRTLPHAALQHQRAVAQRPSFPRTTTAPTPTPGPQPRTARVLTPIPAIVPSAHVVPLRAVSEQTASSPPHLPSPDKRHGADAHCSSFKWISTRIIPALALPWRVDPRVDRSTRAPHHTSPARDTPRPAHPAPRKAGVPHPPRSTSSLPAHPPGSRLLPKPRTSQIPNATALPLEKGEKERERLPNGGPAPVGHDADV